jgi:hypothetical protein
MDNYSYEERLKFLNVTASNTRRSWTTKDLIEVLSFLKGYDHVTSRSLSFPLHEVYKNSRHKCTFDDGPDIFKITTDICVEENGILYERQQSVVIYNDRCFLLVLFRHDGHT